ncbi:MAG: hypothetical protein AAF226_02195 [Verrucomicrobiota bacterium]
MSKIGFVPGGSRGRSVSGRAEVDDKVFEHEGKKEFPDWQDVPDNALVKWRSLKPLYVALEKFVQARGGGVAGVDNVENCFWQVVDNETTGGFGQAQIKVGGGFVHPFGEIPEKIMGGSGAQFVYLKYDWTYIGTDWVLTDVQIQGFATMQANQTAAGGSRRFYKLIARNLGGNVFEQYLCHSRDVSLCPSTVQMIDVPLV